MPTRRRTIHGQGGETVCNLSLFDGRQYRNIPDYENVIGEQLKLAFARTDVTPWAQAFVRCLAF